MDKPTSLFPSNITPYSYSSIALPHLQSSLDRNAEIMSQLAQQVVQNVIQERLLFVFGSGHSGILPLELYHRAGGPSFLIPLVADYLLPQAGPPVVRVLERTAGSANFLLNRHPVKSGEMLWIMSQSGINAAGVDFAIEAKKKGMTTVAFTSKTHSQSVPSRHSSEKKLFEVCDHVIDLGGVVGDAALEISQNVFAGPLSTLTAIFLSHSILAMAMSELENKGISCTYTSVNTPEGEKRNLSLEKKASERDYLLR